MRDTVPSKLNSGLKLIILSLLGASLLAGCGVQGSLKTPPPIFGEGSSVDPDRVPTEKLEKPNDQSDLDLLDDEPEPLDDE